MFRVASASPISLKPAGICAPTVFADSTSASSSAPVLPEDTAMVSLISSDVLPILYSAVPASTAPPVGGIADVDPAADLLP